MRLWNSFFNTNNKASVEVGWLLQTDHAQFIWDEPRSAKRKMARSANAKAITYCPAVLDYETRLIEIPCPFDLKLRLHRGEDGAFKVYDALGISSGMSPKVFANMVQQTPTSQWRDPSRPIVQIRTPYTFIADEPVYMNQLPPFNHYLEHQMPGLVIGGRVPIHIWPRALAFAFEWHDTSQELVLLRGQPWFLLKFETNDPTRHVRLDAAEMTPQLKEYLAGIKGVVGYTNGTFSLFKTALRRRPRLLLKKVKLEASDVTSSHS
jgi:hypothetical protein